MSEQETRIVTCHTDGCLNKDIDIELPDNGTFVICGVCRAKIADEEPEKAQAFLEWTLEQEGIS